MRKKNFAPTIYPKNADMRKVWFVQYYDANGKLKKAYGRLAHYTTVGDKMKEAKRIIASLDKPLIGERELKKQRKLVHLLSEIIEDKRPGLAKKTYQTYFYYLKKFSTWYNKEFAKNKLIDPSRFIIHLQNEKYHTNLVRKISLRLKSWFAILVKKGLYPNNPFEDIKIKKVKAKSKLPFNDEQIAELLPIITEKDPQLRDVVDFLYYLYFRPAEVRLLKIEHIMFYEMKVMATPEITKDNDNYLKIVPEQMKSHILKYKSYNPNCYIFSANGTPGTKPVGMNEFTKRMTKILRSLNYSNRYSLYSWVHTGIKKAALSGIPIKQLQLQKGHSDLNMFNEYLKDLGIDDCKALVTQFPTL